MHLGPYVLQPDVLKEMPFPDDFRMAGWVYILSNEYMPGIYKVGMTTNSPESRAKELSSSTGVPFPFKVEASYHCQDPAYSESEIHSYLSEFRINNSREFFQLDLEELKAACEEFCDAEVGLGVEYFANTYEVFSFETLKTINLEELFEDLELMAFGNKMAIAERLIRFGAKKIQDIYLKQNLSVVFKDGEVFAVEDPIRMEISKSKAREAEKIKELEGMGIYGPNIPSCDPRIPF